MTSKRRKKHKPEQIVAKLRDADAMLNAGKHPARGSAAHEDGPWRQNGPRLPLPTCRQSTEG